MFEIENIDNYDATDYLRHLKNDYNVKLEEIENFRSHIEFMQRRFTSFQRYLTREGHVNKKIADELESISTDYAKAVKFYSGYAESFLIKYYNKLESNFSKSINEKMLQAKLMKYKRKIKFLKYKLKFAELATNHKNEGDQQFDESQQEQQSITSSFDSSFLNRIKKAKFLKRLINSIKLKNRRARIDRIVKCKRLTICPKNNRFDNITPPSSFNGLDSSGANNSILNDEREDSVYAVSKLNIEENIQPLEILDNLKYILETENIPKAKFAHCILKCSKTAFIEILLKTRNWKENTQKVNKNIKVIYAWLLDKDRMTKLTCDYNSNVKPNDLTAVQIDSLKRVFEENRYQSTSQIKELAKRLSISSKIVKYWFINERYLNRKKHENTILLPIHNLASHIGHNDCDMAYNVLNLHKIKILNDTFNKNQYPNNQTVEYLSEALGLSIGKIYGWFAEKRNDPISEVESMSETNKHGLNTVEVDINGSGLPVCVEKAE